MRESHKFRGPYVKPDSVRFPPQPGISMPAMPPLKLIAVLEFWTKITVRRLHFTRLFLPLLQESDDLVADIGFRRDEICWALQLPLKVDAMKALESCRRQRMQATQAARDVLNLDITVGQACK